MRNNYKKIHKGFTLVETLIAIGILSLSILATFTSVQGGLQSSYVAKDQTTAFFLTQEAMEFIRNVRDENALNSISGTPNNWLNGLAENSSDPCYYGETCIIDSYLQTATQCDGGFGTCPNLRQDPTTKLMGYTGSWASTNFTREIQFQNLGADSVRVTIKISWNVRETVKTFEISQLLFDRS